MHDLRAIRDEPAAFDRGLARRGFPPSSHEVLALDAERRRLQTEAQTMLARRNAASKEIGAAKQKGEDATALIEEVARLKQALPDTEAREKEVAEQLELLLAALPNLPANDVPDGTDESGNVEQRRWGNPIQLDGAKDHAALGEALGLMDFATASKLSGSRFTLLKGDLARLERALGDFMLDLATREFGYQEISPPLLVRDAAMFGTAQLPKFRDDQFGTTTGYWLIPTAEVPLTNIVADEILERETLPLRFTARTHCFRAEAGAAGRDTRGMIRQHQFVKVELVSIVAPEDSASEHERMTEVAETVLKRLELPFRTMLLCAGDMGFAARKTYDLEVWLPGQGAYREISSCSNCGDFQARRMRARSRSRGEAGHAEFVHTLNGSGVAVGRALIAVLENYQQPDGSIAIPDVLKPYMGGVERIAPVAQ